MKIRLLVVTLALASSIWALVEWLQPETPNYFVEPAGSARARTGVARIPDPPGPASAPSNAMPSQSAPATGLGANPDAAGELPRTVTPAVVRASGAAPTESSPGNPHPDPAFTSRDGHHTFRVPSPSDPEYADYLEMLRHPAYRSAGEGAPGYALPYDPEWRSMVTGRRAASEVEDEFVDAAPSLDDLAREIVGALQGADDGALHRLRIDQREFTEICWPEFPQSRPYLKIPAVEAWNFHSAQCAEGVVGALRAHGGQPLEVQAVEYGAKRQYRNFTLYDDVVLRVRDASGREGALRFVRSIAERQGGYKVFIYHG